jgi:hypothetical protein
VETTVQGYTALTYSTGMEFRERIYPSLGVTFALLALVLATSFAIWAALETIIAIAFALVATVLASIWWVGAIHKIEFDGDWLRVNHARIEVKHLFTPVFLDGQQWRQRLGADFDPALFHAHRFWMRSGVEVSLRDERDPHRGWLIGSREGRRLVSALVEALGTASREGKARGLDD